jgi:hypothetical protein
MGAMYLFWTDWFLFMLKVDELEKKISVASRDPTFYLT